MTSEAYVAGLVRRAEQRRLPDLPGAAGGALLAEVSGFGDGLASYALRAADLPEDLAEAIYAFRLAEFLRIGMMSASLAQGLRLDREPVDDTTIHTVTLDPHGRIVGYLALVGAPTGSAAPLDDPVRGRYPVEIAHEVDLLSPFASPGLDTGAVFELKRFVRVSGLPRGMVRDRVPWHLIVALARTVFALPAIRVVVGDTQEQGAMLHLRLLGFDPVIHRDTAPRLPRTALMWPSYEVESPAVPFAAPWPSSAADRVTLIEAQLRAPHGPEWAPGLVRRLMALGSERDAA